MRVSEVLQVQFPQLCLAATVVFKLKKYYFCLIGIVLLEKVKYEND